jgi:hypothetical protein
MADSITARRFARALLVAALLPALIAPPAALANPNPADRAKREQTLQTMRALIDALFGRDGSSGYIADMGQVPASLEALAVIPGSPGSPPAFALLNTGSLSGALGAGYRGPYLEPPRSATGRYVDAWNSPITMVTTTTTLQLHSGGPDRNLATTADNVVYPLTPAVTHGTIELKVDCGATGLLGILPCDLPAITATVGISNAGTIGTPVTALLSVAGVLEANNVHVGPHVVTVNALVPANFDLGVASTRVVLRGRRATARLKLIEKPLLSLPTGYPICHCTWWIFFFSCNTIFTSSLSRLFHILHGDQNRAC